MIEIARSNLSERLQQNQSRIFLLRILAESGPIPNGGIVENTWNTRVGSHPAHR